MIRALVTGGGGFVGTAIVKRLLTKGCEVQVFGRNRYPHLEALGVHCWQGDIGNAAQIEAACNGMDTVFHTAAKAGIWGSWGDYQRTNVTGTHNVIEACLKNRVERLVYTSTPSVVFDKHDIVGGDESLPYPTSFLSHYARSKVLAEQLVLNSNQDQLCTCAIRPHLIWGPGDPHLIPRLVERGKQGALPIVGSGSNLVDITFVDNVAHAHILAAQHLTPGSVVSGEPYFVGQEQPVNLWDWINELYADLGIPQIKKTVSLTMAYYAGALLEGIHRMFRPEVEPKMTRFLALQLARSHYFSHAKAEAHFGYEPIVSLAEGKMRLLTWLKSEVIA